MEDRSHFAITIPLIQIMALCKRVFSSFFILLILLLLLRCIIFLFYALYLFGLLYQNLAGCGWLLEIYFQCDGVREANAG